MPARVYVIAISPPAAAAVGTLRHKRIPHRVPGVRVLLEFEDVSGLVEERPCATAAWALFPDWVGPVPRGLGDAQLSDGSAGIVDSSR